MKTILIFSLMTAALFSSCKKSYLDTYTTTSVAAADELLSTQNAYAALNGIHRIMYV